ncbi:MAG: choice-of-anchor L domain-containing protein [Bacteroidales bacterium]|nr:choice-of-anchor L domain-containing protein [Bacteroidales bacterium]
MKHNFVLILTLYTIKIYSQLNINTSYTPQQLVTNFLVGGGVNISNVTFTGQSSQIGYFTNGNSTPLGINEGIILTTGNVTNVAQPGSAFMSDNLGGAGVPELTNIAGSTTYDGAVLQFNFVPLGTPITFVYVFGSEEYPEWVGSSFNDAFAFFVSGPNPSGGNYNNVNIALIPGTSTPVTINNVNQNSYSQYYVNNNGSSTHPVFDGFTTPLVAQLNVVPCQTYTIKICIADAGDQAFDSGVFLKANSFGSVALNVQYPQASSGENYAIEGCTGAIINFTLPVPAQQNMVLNLNYSGTATNGVDVNQLPSSVTIPAGQTSVSLNVTAVYDGISEGMEYLIISIPTQCGQNFVSDTVYIVDATPLSVNAGADQTVCDYNLPVSLSVTTQGGSGSLNYQWSTGQTTQSIQVTPPVGSSHYVVTVSDACGQTATDAVDVTVNQTPTSTFTATNICAGEPSTITYTGNAGPNATYNWNFAGATIISGGTGQGPHQITWNTPGTYTLTLTVTQNGCTSQTTSVQVTVYGLGSPMCCSLPTPNAGPDKTVCGLSTTLECIPSMNGSWSVTPSNVTFSNVSNPNATVTVTQEGTYQFVWTETVNPSCWNADTVVITFYQQPVANAGNNFSVCSHQFQLNASMNVGIGTWSANPSNGVTFSNVNNPNTTVNVQNDGVYTFTWFVNNNGCTASSTVTVSSYQQPNANAGNDTAVCGLTYTLNAIPSVGNGVWSTNLPNLVMFSNIYSPTTQILVSQTGQYVFVWTENNNGCIDSDTVVVQLTRIPSSTFTATPIKCFGDASTITYTGVADGVPQFIWNWGGGYAAPGTGIGPHQVYWPTAGQHSISLQVSVNGCLSTITTVNIINPDSLSLFLSKTDVLCFGQSNGSVTANVTGGTPPYTYYWSNGANTSALSNIPANVYLVTVLDNNGCSKVSGIEVKQPPKLIANVTPSQNICLGQSATLTINVSGGTPPYNFFWNGEQSNPTIIVFPEENTTYYAQVVDFNGCSTSMLSTTVYIAPPIQTQLVANTNIVCPGDPVMLSPIIWGGVGPPYIIYNQAGNVVTPPIIINPQESGYYWILIEDACGTKDTSSIYIQTYPLPSINVIADTVQGCVPLTVHFHETSPDSGQTYLWNFGDNSNLSIQKNPVHVYNIPGTFTVQLTVTSKEGCEFSKTYPNFIKVWPRPTASFKWEPQVVNEINAEVQFENMSNGGSIYIWDFGDGDSSTNKHPIHKYEKAGDYIVKLITISEKGCKDTATALLTVVEPHTFYAPDAFSPDGNKVNDYFFIKGHGIKEEGFLLEIYDRWGNVIWSTNKFYVDKERSEGWDGRTTTGKFVPPDVYTWKVIYKDKRNLEHVESGRVVVLR